MTDTSLGKIEKLIEEVAPKIERLTGWNAHNNDLKIKLVEREQLWENAKVFYESLSIDTKPITEEEHKMFEEELERSQWIFAEYVIPTDTMLIVPENIKNIKDVNESIIKTILTHELMHRCQYLNNPKFTKRYNNIIKKLYGSRFFDEDWLQDKRYEKIAEAYDSLTEGDALHAEMQLAEIEYPETRDAILTFNQCHQNARKIIDNIFKAKGRSGINEMYNLNIKELCRIFKNA